MNEVCIRAMVRLTLPIYMNEACIRALVRLTLPIYE